MCFQQQRAQLILVTDRVWMNVASHSICDKNYLRSLLWTELTTSFLFQSYLRFRGHEKRLRGEKYKYIQWKCMSVYHFCAHSLSLWQVLNNSFTIRTKSSDGSKRYIPLNSFSQSTSQVTACDAQPLILQLHTYTSYLLRTRPYTVL